MAAAKKDIQVFETKSDITSFQGALDYFRSKGIEVKGSQELADVLGDGFTFVPDKSKLVNRGFAIVDYRSGMSTSYNIPMVSVWGITKDGERFKFVDMSTGIAQQLKNAEEKNVSPVGFFINDGLVRSDYVYQDETGKEIPATTYYLAV